MFDLFCSVFILEQTKPAGIVVQLLQLWGETSIRTNTDHTEKKNSSSFTIIY